MFEFEEEDVGSKSWADQGGPTPGIVCACGHKDKALASSAGPIIYDHRPLVNALQKPASLGGFCRALIALQQVRDTKNLRVFIRHHGGRRREW